MQIGITNLTCKKCQHRWIPRKAEVRQCPKCKTAYWDKDRGMEISKSVQKK